MKVEIELTDEQVDALRRIQPGVVVGIGDYIGVLAALKAALPRPIQVGDTVDWIWANGRKDRGTILAVDADQAWVRLPDNAFERTRVTLPLNQLEAVR